MRMSAGALAGIGLLLALALIVNGCRTRLPDIKAQVLLEFGKYVPPEREQFLIEKAGGLYALGYRQESAGPFAVQIYRDQLYDPAHQLHLDLYLPSGSQRPYPLVVLVHGGGWQYFSKVAVSGFGKLLASHGLTAAAIDYRLANEAPWPAQLRDLRQSLAWLQGHAAQLGVDVEHWVALGDSAGAQLAAMLALTPGDYPRPQAVVGYYGPYDLCSLLERDEAQAAENPINQLLGIPPADADTACRLASPLYHVDSTAPPFLLIHGTDDSLVQVAQTEDMASSLAAKGVPVSTIYVENADHLLLSLPEPPAPSLRAVDKAVIDFLHLHLTPKQ